MLQKQGDITMSTESVIYILAGMTVRVPVKELR